MSALPLNMRLKIRDDNMYADRAVQLRESEIVAHQAQWAAAQSTKTVNPKELERERKRQEEELRVTAEELTIVRRARLTELYAAEYEMWQTQLAARGLAIEPRTF